VKTGHCYCDALLLADGTCRYKCPPEANPAYLRAKAKREREAREKAKVEARDVGTVPYRAAMSAACAKFDPVVRYNRERTMRAVRKSHGPGNRRGMSWGRSK
jgi:hypothetical protein